MKTIWVPISGQIAQQKKIDMIANNIANANTNGFKRDEIAFKEYLTALDKGITDIDIPNKEWSPQDFYHSYGAENSMVKVDGNYTDFSQAQIIPTGNPLDLAIEGKGFLEVLTDRGVRYSRGGHFSRDSFGRLIDTQGNFLLAKNDSEKDPSQRIVTIPNSAFRITQNGSLFAGEQNIATLSIQEFSDLNALRKEGGQLYINPYPGNISKNQVESRIFQGAIEGSNVNAMKEMSELIKAQRHFETIQNAVKTYDQVGQQIANEISRF